MSEQARVARAAAGRRNMTLPFPSLPCAMIGEDEQSTHRGEGREALSRSVLGDDVKSAPVVGPASAVASSRSTLGAPLSAELDRLIAEQTRDAQSFRVFGLSLDAFPDLMHRASRKLVTDPRHGTLNCYTNLGCRCAKCRAASAEAKREQRRRRRVEKGPYTYRLCCQACGSENIERQRMYGDAA